MLIRVFNNNGDLAEIINILSQLKSDKNNITNLINDNNEINIKNSLKRVVYSNFHIDKNISFFNKLTDTLNIKVINKGYKNYHRSYDIHNIYLLSEKKVLSDTSHKKPIRISYKNKYYWLSKKLKKEMFQFI